LSSRGINQFLALLEFFSSRVLPFVIRVFFAGKSQCLFLSRVCYIKAPLFLSIFFISSRCALCLWIIYQ
ncbi:hypothetical protein GIB67_018566, partial [Kingdonia uniflora]